MPVSIGFQYWRTQFAYKFSFVIDLRTKSEDTTQLRYVVRWRTFMGGSAKENTGGERHEGRR